MWLLIIYTSIILIEESNYFPLSILWSRDIIVHFCSSPKPRPHSQIAKRISWRIGKTVAGIIVAIVHPLDSLSPVSTAFNRGEKRSARIKITAPCSRRYHAEIKMAIAVWFPLRPNRPPPPLLHPSRPRFSRIRREDRSFECITNLKPGVSIKQRLDPPPLQPLGWFPGMCSLWGWLLRLISRCRV